MPIEEHPSYPRWREALENLIAAKEAFRNDNASQQDVDDALQAYFEIADDL
jgi:hypothetical protein